MKILAIKFNGLGDVAIGVRMLKAVKAQYPDATIDYMIPGLAIPVVKNVPWIRNIIDAKRGGGWRSWWSTFKQLLQLRKEKYDLSIDLTELDRGAIASFVIGAKVRAGIVAPGGFLGRKYCYTVCWDKDESPLRSINERDLLKLAVLGIPKPKDNDPEIYSNPQYRSYAQNLIGYKEKILCFLGSSNPAKNLPLESWVAIYEKCKNHYSLVFTSGKSPTEIQEMSQFKASYPGVPVIEPPSSIDELMSLIKAAKGVITNDTFCSHAAAGLKTPVVTLFGPTSSVIWAPGGNSIPVSVKACQCGETAHAARRCLIEKTCLYQIKPEDVIEALGMVLKKDRRPENI